MACRDCGFECRRGHGCFCCVLYSKEKRQNAGQSRQRRKNRLSTNKVKENTRKFLVGGEMFRTSPDRPRGQPNLLYNGHWVSYPGVNRPWRGVNHEPPCSAEVKERVQLYLYSPSGLSWPVLGQTLPFTYIIRIFFSCTSFMLTCCL